MSQFKAELALYSSIRDMLVDIWSPDMPNARISPSGRLGIFFSQQVLFETLEDRIKYLGI